ncbi:MAG TPA: glycosyltransferase family 2 protein [Acidimicrobiia bacterium]|nr:glycosyltransferase family 2 protein [Acidimicrobiia bacterium]
MSPLVSVCVPTYNGDRYVERTVRSALEQTLTDLEVIVSDDGSVDATLDVVRTIDDARVRIVTNPGAGGASSNWNHAVSLARGNYVKVLCQDDELYPECLARQVDAMERGRADHVVLVGCRRDIVDDRDRVIHARRGWSGAPTVASGAAVARASVRAGTNVVGEPSSTLFRRDALDRIGGFAADQAYMIDLDAWTRMLQHGTLAYVQDALCTFRVSSNSWSARLAREQARQARSTLQAIKARYPDAVSAGDVRIGSLRALALAYVRRVVFALSSWLPERGRSGQRRPGPARPSPDVV